MLQLTSVSTAYGGAVVNRNVSLELNKGEILSLIGRNGVGKSTLAKAIIGLHPILSGSVIFNNREITRMAANLRAQLGIGYVPQGRGIFVDMTVEDNLRMGGLIGAEAKPLAHVFELFPMLKDRKKQLGGTLSGGQQQMLSIGRVLVGTPRILILDEPSDGIQPNVVEQIGEMCRKLNSDTNLPVLLIEQNLDLIVACAHRCAVMEKGSITSMLNPKELENPNVAKQALAI